MSVLLKIIIATALISAGSFVGILTLAFNQSFIRRILLNLVALAAGTMFAAALLHLMPESINSVGAMPTYIFMLAAFVAFYVVEKFLHWHHCHDPRHIEKHTLGYMNLIGDTFHNFLDGLLIAGSFTVSSGLGFVATLAVIFHEIPQEIGDFGVLLHSGFTRRYAVLANALVGVTAVAGGVIGYLASANIQNFANYLIPFSAGGLLYISTADLMPEIKKEAGLRKSLSLLLTFLLGSAIMMLVKD